MNTKPELLRGARLMLFAALLVLAATAGVRAQYDGIVASDPEGNLMTAQAADPHAGHPMPAAPASAVVHKAEGIVRSLGDEIVIKHGPIPSFGMGAMTMAYKAPKGGVPKDVKAGTNVKFEFVVTAQGDMQLTSIVPGGGGGK